MWKGPQLEPRHLWPQQTSKPKPLYALVWNFTYLGPWADMWHSTQEHTKAWVMRFARAKGVGAPAGALSTLKKV